MIVVDASAVIELLLNSVAGTRVADRIFVEGESLHVHSERAAQALDDFNDLPLHRYAHIDFIPRIWELRTSMTAYDAAYVCLAEALDETLLTCDLKLRNSHGRAARIELV